MSLGLPPTRSLQQQPAQPMSQDEALQVLAKWAVASDSTLSAAAELEANWELWLTTLYRKWVSNSAGNLVPFAPHMQAFWKWVWSISVGYKPDPFVGVWPRGGAKSTSVELACAALAARRVRRYALYICATQEQADDHVGNVGALLENPEFARYYPAASRRMLGKYGSSRGWRRNRLRTASGFTVDAIGLDTAARGVKLENARPDLIVLDDIDEELDGPTATDKKITVLTRKLLPAGSDDSAVLAVQNQVISNGIFARLAGVEGADKADFLQDRIVSGPIPAVYGPVVNLVGGKYYLVGGTPAWEGQNLEKCQSQIGEWGYSSWKIEAQHDVDTPIGGMFEDIDFERIHVTPEQLPELERVAVWVDPAVTSTDKSDSHGVSAGGRGVDGRIYVLRSWEGRDTPAKALERAITWALELKADHVGVETDQGGDLWATAYDSVWDEMVVSGKVHLPVSSLITQRLPTNTNAKGLSREALLQAASRLKPPFKSEKAGSGHGPKSHRASLMHVDFEPDHDVFRILVPSEKVAGDTGYIQMERALKRFPLKKPFDLTDATYWMWNDLKDGALNGVGATDDSPSSEYVIRSYTAPTPAPAVGTPLRGHPETIGRVWAEHRQPQAARTFWRRGITAPHAATGADEVTQTEAPEPPAA